ncbi:MAG: hypothetical protein JRJ85_20095 [Deltaproteobacteria bacterium]|nr:hypothetical protein [Deltaproteobacteria bacterium]
MPNYPIKMTGIPPKALKAFGAASAKEMAAKIENYINENSKGLPAKIFDYARISVDLGIDIETIRLFLSSLGGGYNGIIIDNPGSDIEV